MQIAKAYGATVTGVCSERNREMVRSIGADHVIDYRQTNYTEGDAQYDLIVDMIGNHSFSANLDVLQPGGRLVVVGGQKGNWIGPISNMIKQPLLSPFLDQEVVVMMAQSSAEELAALANFMERGELVPVIDRVYPLSEVPAAMAYLEEGHARGKVVIEIGSPGDEVRYKVVRVCRAVVGHRGVILVVSVAGIQAAGAALVRRNFAQRTRARSECTGRGDFERRPRRRDPSRQHRVWIAHRRVPA